MKPNVMAQFEGTALQGIDVVLQTGLTNPTQIENAWMASLHALDLLAKVQADFRKDTLWHEKS